MSRHGISVSLQERGILYTISHSPIFPLSKDNLQTFKTNQAYTQPYTPKYSNSNLSTTLPLNSISPTPTPTAPYTLVSPHNLNTTVSACTLDILPHLRKPRHNALRTLRVVSDAFVRGPAGGELVGELF